MTGGLAMSDFLEATSKAFQDLLSYGDIRIESDHYDSQAFGNAVVVMAGRGFQLRLQRDRGDVSADVAASTTPEDWTPLERALTAVGAPHAPEEGLLTPAEAADLVRANLALLESGFSAARIDETRRKLEELRRWRLASAMRRLRQRRDVTEE
jgi:hypothetical protein